MLRHRTHPIRTSRHPRLESCWNELPSRIVTTTESFPALSFQAGRGWGWNSTPSSTVEGR